MLRHADTVFSSITTAGSPLPLWSSGDGTGQLLLGNSPVGGSGVNMSGNVNSLTQYLDVHDYNKTDWNPVYSNSSGFAEPGSELWLEFVDSNPLYK